MAGTVTVKSGDTLSAIAKANNTTVKAIQNANPSITNANVIKPGQIFTLPGAVAPMPAASTIAAVPVSSGSGIDFAAANQAILDAVNAANQTTNTLVNQMLQQQASAAATAKAEAEKAVLEKQTNWIATAKSLLSTYDLSSLGDKYISLITTGGYDDATAMIKIQSEPEWQARFAGNQSRLKQGLPVLSPAEYLSTEAAYKDVMIQAGLPEAVYKDTKTLGDLIAQDISPTEVQQRVTAAREVIDNADPYITLALQQQFGLSKGDMVLHVLDAKLASNVIAQKVQASQIAGEANRQGLGVDLQTSADLAAQGVTQAQARAGYANIAQALPEEQRLSVLYGEDAGKVGNQLTAATFGTAGAAAARTSLANLTQKEINAFSGSAGASKGSLGEDSTGLL